MVSYKKMNKEELLQEKESLVAAYKEYQSRDLSFNMARGKPSPAQLDLSAGLLTCVDENTAMEVAEGIDIRNYGGLDGIEGAKKVLATMADVEPESVVVFGNSSLNIMYDQIARGMISGYMGATPWCKLNKVKWLCPVPGYDRHFAITEHFGIEMINIPMSESGPDMDMVEELVANDASIKGIWCVPKYTNPQGYVYSDETIERLASLSPAAEDFRIFWDNAYCVHDLYEEVKIANIFELAAAHSKEDMIFEFVSTSKVSFAGAGIAGFVASPNNIKDIKKSMTMQTIGHDKINQLRHAIFFDEGRGIAEHMKKHAEILRPKFENVLTALENNLGGRDAGTWVKPLGGYFITFEAVPGTATKIISLAKEAGLTMTGAGAPFPYHNDPKDSVIRIAPSYPTADEMKEAAELFTICVRIATIDKYLEKR